MKKFEAKLFNPEKKGINDYIIELITNLCDEQDFQVNILNTKSPLTFEILHAPGSIVGANLMPTKDELEIFFNTAITRMKDSYPKYTWSEGLEVEFEELNKVSIWIDEDKLGLEY